MSFVVSFSFYSPYTLYHLKYYPVDALKEIASTMGATYWKFDGDSCQIQMVGLTPEPPNGAESSIDCGCPSEENTVCNVTHVVRMYNSIFSS